MGMPVDEQGVNQGETLNTACRNAVLGMIALLQARGYRESRHTCSAAWRSIPDQQRGGRAEPRGLRAPAGGHLPGVTGDAASGAEASSRERRNARPQRETRWGRRATPTCAFLFASFLLLLTRLVPLLVPITQSGSILRLTRCAGRSQTRTDGQSAPERGSEGGCASFTGTAIPPAPAQKSRASALAGTLRAKRLRWSSTLALPPA